jgi:hypothetical protein
MDTERITVAIAKTTATADVMWIVFGYVQHIGLVVCNIDVSCSSVKMKDQKWLDPPPDESHGLSLQ